MKETSSESIDKQAGEAVKDLLSPFWTNVDSKVYRNRRSFMGAISILPVAKMFGRAEAQAQGQIITVASIKERLSYGSLHLSLEQKNLIDKQVVSIAIALTKFPIKVDSGKQLNFRLVNGTSDNFTDILVLPVITASDGENNPINTATLLAPNLLDSKKPGFYPEKHKGWSSIVPGKGWEPELQGKNNDWVLRMVHIKTGDQKEFKNGVWSNVIIEANSTQRLNEKLGEVSIYLNKNMSVITEFDFNMAESLIIEARILQLEIVSTLVNNNQELLELVQSLKQQFDANGYVALLSRVAKLETGGKMKLLLTPNEQIRIFAQDGVMSGAENLKKIKGVTTGPNHFENMKNLHVTAGEDANGRYVSVPINPSVLLGQNGEDGHTYTVPNAISMVVLGELDDSVKVGMGTAGGIDFARETDVYVLGTKAGVPLAAVGFCTWGSDSMRNFKYGKLAKWIYGPNPNKFNDQLTDAVVADAMGFVRHPASLLVGDTTPGDKYNFQVPFTVPVLGVNETITLYTPGIVKIGQFMSVQLRKQGTQDGATYFDLLPAVTRTGILIPTYGSKQANVIMR